MLYSTLLRGAFQAILGPLPPAPPSHEAEALVLVADGVGGLDLCGMGLKYAAAREAPRHRIELVAWGHGLGRWLSDLTDVANHAAQAEAIAGRVAAFRAARPETPVFLVAKSGGSGPVVRALERLPEGSIERAILLAPALSPSYDLSIALRAVRREMVVYWSPLDVFILGAGTALFGTVDRVRTAGAGMVGFRCPPQADEAAYAKLRQVRWRVRMCRGGYFGGHVGPDSPGFLRREVVPLLEAAGHSPTASRSGSSPTRPAPIT